MASDELNLPVPGPSTRRARVDEANAGPKRVPSRGVHRAIAVKRAREDASADDGMRVLVDRLWPRGLTKERVAADLWLRELAPSTALRRWYGHEPCRWASFTQKYRAELAQCADLLLLLDELHRRGRLTLVYDASDASHNNAVVLREVLTERRFAALSANRS